MSAHTAVALRQQSAPDLPAEYADAVEMLPIGPDAKRVRNKAARRLLTRHADLDTFMGRPTPARVVDIDRSGAWCFLSWCFLEGHLQPDLDLLLAKMPGDLYRRWADRHGEDVARLREVAKRFSFSANWTRDLVAGLAMICLCRHSLKPAVAGEEAAERAVSAWVKSSSRGTMVVEVPVSVGVLFSSSWDPS